MHRCTLKGATSRQDRQTPCSSAPAAEALEPRRLLAAAYAVTDLGVLDHHDFEYSEGFGINNRGQVGGVSDTGEPLFIDEDGNVFYINHAFRWDQQSGMTDLGEPGVLSVGTNINNAGEVVGVVEVPGVPDPVNGGNAGHPAVWDKSGALLDLGTTAGKVNGTGWGINDRGDAVGWVYDTDPDLVDSAVAPPNAVPFVYDQRTGIRPLPMPAGFKNGFAGDINNQGVVAGNTADNLTLHPFAWVPGPHGTYAAVDLGIPAGFNRGATRAVNNRGQIAGELRVATSGGPVMVHAVVWTPAPGGGAGAGFVPTDIGVPAGGTTASPRDINARGEVVGVARIGRANRAFLYDQGGMHNLNDLIPADSGWVLSSARSINDRGQITGLGLHDGEFHAFVLTPAVGAGGHGAAGHGAAEKAHPPTRVLPSVSSTAGVSFAGFSASLQEDDGPESTLA